MMGIIPSSIIHSRSTESLNAQDTTAADNIRKNFETPEKVPTAASTPSPITTISSGFSDDTVPNNNNTSIETARLLEKFDELEQRLKDLEENGNRKPRNASINTIFGTNCSLTVGAIKVLIPILVVFFVVIMMLRFQSEFPNWQFWFVLLLNVFNILVIGINVGKIKVGISTVRDQEFSYKRAVVTLSLSVLMAILISIELTQSCSSTIQQMVFSSLISIYCLDLVCLVVSSFKTQKCVNIFQNVSLPNISPLKNIHLVRLLSNVQHFVTGCSLLYYVNRINDFCSVIFVLTFLAGLIAMAILELRAYLMVMLTCFILFELSMLEMLWGVDSSKVCE